VFGRQHYAEILIMLGKRRFGENFEVNFGEGWVKRIQH